MRCVYIIKNEQENTYYDGSNSDEEILNGNFTDSLEYAMTFQSYNEVRMEYIPKIKCDGYFRIIEIFKTD